MHTQGFAEWVRTRDGRLLYTQRLDAPSGTKPPIATVIFEGGDGATRSFWADVQLRTARFARAIVYDRSGIGRSPVDPENRALTRMADDLVDVVTHFAQTAEGPIVLVGHSLGGPLARQAASSLGAAVQGIVLVDPSDEAADSMFVPWFRPVFRGVLRTMRILARLGVLRWLFRTMIASAPAEDVRDDLRREGFVPGLITTQLRQGETFLPELREWREHPPALTKLEATVISGGSSAGMGARVRTNTNQAHALRAAAYSAPHVIAQHSGHNVPLTEPDVVAAEIERVIDRIAQANANPRR